MVYQGSDRIILRIHEIFLEIKYNDSSIRERSQMMPKKSGGFRTLNIIRHTFTQNSQVLSFLTM